jgi:hypothetical protein
LKQISDHEGLAGAQKVPEEMVGVPEDRIQNAHGEVEQKNIDVIVRVVEVKQAPEAGRPIVGVEEGAPRLARLVP